MKQSTLLLFLLTSFFLSSSKIDKSRMNYHDFSFTIEFYPAFNNISRILIEKKGSIETISIDIIYCGKFKRLLKNKELEIQKVESLLIEKSDHQYFGDTVGSPFLVQYKNIIFINNFISLFA
jgi:hypothetical protein